MALVIESKKPFYTTTETSLRLGIFLAHAISAILMLTKANGNLDAAECESVIFPALRQVTMDNSYVREVNPPLYLMPMERRTNLTSCANDTSWNKGWCKFGQLPQFYDYESDVDSFVFGSSWNVIFAVTVFEWITSSYALFYFDPFDSWLTYESLWWGIHPIPATCSFWNLFLILFMWVNRASMKVPYNNAFLYTMVLGITIVIQNFLSINRSWRIDNEKEDPPYIESKGTKESVYNINTDMFLRKRKKDYQPLMRTVGADFHEPSYMLHFDKCSCSPIPRYLEYLITAPLLLVALYVSSVSSDLVWKIQFVGMALVACNAVGIPLHYSVLNISCDVQRYAPAAAYFLIASWICLISGIYVFVWTIRDFLLESDSGMPQWVQMLVWLLLIMYSLFGVAASRYYLPKIAYNANYGPEEYRWLSFYFDILSLLVKLPVAWTIWVKGATMMCEKAVTCPT